MTGCTENLHCNSLGDPLCRNGNSVSILAFYENQNMFDVLCS